MDRGSRKKSDTALAPPGIDNSDGTTPKLSSDFVIGKAFYEHNAC
jgi:hypothetical protein